MYGQFDSPMGLYRTCIVQEGAEYTRGEIASASDILTSPIEISSESYEHKIAPKASPDEEIIKNQSIRQRFIRAPDSYHYHIR